MQSDPGIYQRNPPGRCHLDQLSYIGTHTLYMLRLFQFHTLTNTVTFTFEDLKFKSRHLHDNGKARK